MLEAHFVPNILLKLLFLNKIKCSQATERKLNPRGTCQRVCKLDSGLGKQVTCYSRGEGLLMFFSVMIVFKLVPRNLKKKKKDFS